MQFTFHYFKGTTLSKPDSVVGFRILMENNRPYLYKYCRSKNASVMKDHLVCFRHEFLKMRSLQKHMTDCNKGDRYKKLFPEYYGYGHRLHNGAPEVYLIMEYIPGKTLQEKLEYQQLKPEHFPYRYLSDAQILKIFKQINEAQFWLSKVGMLQLDLNPGNLIITDEASFKIKMVDFTDALFLTREIRENRRKYNPNRSYKLFDDLFIEKTFKNRPALQLREAGILLYTRLFYDSYETYKAKHSFQKPDLLFDPYKELLDRYAHIESTALASQSPEKYLVYWNDWIEKLNRVLCEF